MRRLLQVLAALGFALVLCGCGDDGDRGPDPGEGGGGSGGGTVDCSTPDPFDPADCPTDYPEYECVVYVDGAVDASGDGWSWSTAVETVQEGIDLARCGALNSGVCEQWQVWVKQGSYYIHQGCREHAVVLRPFVSVYGGFAGTESTVFDRDWQQHETILDGRDGPSDPATAERVYHVTVGADDAVLDGFTIQYGKADHLTEEVFQQGAGMGNLQASPTVANCLFRDNVAKSGAGMTNYESSPDVTNCIFRDNVAQEYGGGMNNLNGSPTVTDCTFDSNEAGVSGGGVGNLQTTVMVTGSTFRDNSAPDTGGGLEANHSTVTITDGTFAGNTTGGNGGGLYFTESEVAVADSVFEQNVSQSGGGMFAVFSDSTLSRCTFDHNETIDQGDEYPNGGGLSINFGSVTVEDCSFNENTAVGGGGALGISNTDDGSVTGSTFDRNVAQGAHGGAITVWNATLSLESNQFSSNQAPVDFDGGAVWFGQGTLTITGCTFDGNTGRYGGGVYACCTGAVSVAQSTFSNNDAAAGGGGMSIADVAADIENCTFRDNDAQVRGGGLTIGAGATGDVVSSIFYRNEAPQGGAMDTGTEGALSLVNCSVAGNTATNTGGGIANALELTIENSIVWGNAPDGIVDVGATAAGVTHSDVQNGAYPHATNIHVDPSFVDELAGDLHLQPGSPCIDLANDAVAPATDFDGNPRVGLPDMGAYEYQP